MTSPEVPQEQSYEDPRFSGDRLDRNDTKDPRTTRQPGERAADRRTAIEEYER